MSAPPPVIRPAVSADAPALARLAERTFRAAFSATNTAHDMDAHCAAHYGATLQLREIEDPAVATLVAEAGVGLVAYAQLRSGHVPACVQAARPIEIQRLYVDGAWHGQGLAQAMMAALLERAAALGADATWLGVWERNPRAIAFYAKCGFRVVGEHLFQLGADAQRDLVLQRP